MKARRSPLLAASLFAMAMPAMAETQRWYQPAFVELGGRLYAQHCAGCHGDRAQGDPNWRERRPDGSWPPPALNGTAHAWHHPLKGLHGVIVNGGPGDRPDKMPAWRGVLSDGEVLAVIAWFQSLWPDQIYQAWARLDARARAGGQSGDAVQRR